MTSEIYEADIRWLNADFRHMTRTGWLTTDEIELMDLDRTVVKEDLEQDAIMRDLRPTKVERLK